MTITQLILPLYTSARSRWKSSRSVSVPVLPSSTYTSCSVPSWNSSRWVWWYCSKSRRWLITLLLSSRPRSKSSLESRIYLPSLQRIALYEVGALALIVPRFAVLAICPPSLSHYIYIIPLLGRDNKDAFVWDTLSRSCRGATTEVTARFFAGEKMW